MKESFYFRSQEKLTDVLDTVLDLEEPEQKAPAQFSTNDDQTSLFLETLQFLVLTKELGDILESGDGHFESSQPRRFVPRPSTGPKIFWAGPKFLCHTQN